MISVPAIRTSALGLLLAAAILPTTGCLRYGIVQAEKSDSIVDLRLVGDARVVARGEAEGDNLLRIPPTAFTVAVGYGAVGEGADAAQPSQAIILGGEACVRDLALGSLGRTSTDPLAITTPFMCGLAPAGPAPTARYTMPAGLSGRSMEKLARELVRRHGDVVFIVGAGKFDILESTVMIRPPVGGRPTFGEEARDTFQEGMVHLNKPAFFAGIIARDAQAAESGFERILFLDPARRSSLDEPMLIHFATLSSLDGVSALEPETAQGKVLEVGRLESASVLQSGEILVYTVDGVDRRN